MGYPERASGSRASITINESVNPFELPRVKSRFSPRDEEDPRPHRDLISEITHGINRRAKGNVGNVHAWAFKDEGVATATLLARSRR